jgi:hypothetical protein
MYQTLLYWAVYLEIMISVEVQHQVNVHTKTTFPDKVCCPMFASWYFVLVLNTQLSLESTLNGDSTDNAVHGNSIRMLFVTACAFDLIHLCISSPEKSKLTVVN